MQTTHFLNQVSDLLLWSNKCDCKSFLSRANERAAGADVRPAHGAEQDDLRLITAHH